MHHVMFDIDGTLVESYELDSECFINAVKDVTGIGIDSNWSKYQHVTDSGILSEIIGLNNISNAQEVHDEVKKVFIKQLEQSIKENAFHQVPGASSFVSLLNSMSNVMVSFATGGWYESAVLKLKSAGIDFSQMPFASSNDHISRIEIMKIAAARANAGKSSSCTYFGDGSWDKEACQQLGFNFVLVGNKLEHKPSFRDFKSTNEILACIGL